MKSAKRTPRLKTNFGTCVHAIGLLLWWKPDEQQSIKEEDETSELSEESDNGSLSEYISSNESVLESIYKSSPFKDFVRNHFDFVKMLVSRNNQMITEYKRSERIAASI